MKALQSKYWYFKNLDFFENVSDEEYRLLEVNSNYINCSKDQFLYLPDEQPEQVYFLKSGYVKIGHYSEDGNEIVSAILNPGEIFGEVTPKQYDTKEFAQALSDVTACAINRQRFEQLIANNHALTIEVLKMVGERYHKLERRFLNMAFKDARARIVDFLKDYASDYGRIKNNVIHIENFLTHQDMASLTATSRQMVTTVLNDLKNNNALDYDRKHIYIFAALEKLE